MKILFVAQNFEVGGVQQSLIYWLKMLENTKFDIDIFSFGKGELISEIPSKFSIRYGKGLLKYITLSKKYLISSKKYFQLLMKTFYFIIYKFFDKDILSKLFDRNMIDKKYDIAISFFTDIPGSTFYCGTNLYVEKKVHAKKKIAWIHNDPELAKFDYSTCVKIYKNYDLIVCVSNACKKKMEDFLPMYAAKMETVYNIFPINDLKQKAQKSKEKKYHKQPIKLITVARIDNEQKQIDWIPIIARKLVERNVKDFIWDVFGDGPNLNENKKICCKYNVTDRVIFHGKTLNPLAQIGNSDLFVLVSKYEGFPMVIGESISIGIPVLVTEYAAAHEQVIDGKNGYVVPQNIDSIVDKLQELLNSREKLNELKCNTEIEQLNRLALNQMYSALGDDYEI